MEKDRKSDFRETEVRYFTPFDGKPKYRCITFYLYVLLDFYNSYLKIRYL